jgi:hypothetical protein
VEASGGNAVITPQIVGLDEGTWQVLPHQTGNGYAMDLETFDSWWISLKKMKEVKLGKHTLYESPAFVGCAVAIDRKLYDRAWGFDAHMRSWGNEDLDLALKVWTLGGRVLHDPSAVVAHRFQSFFENYTVSAEYPLANHIRSARKHFTQSMWEDWLERAQQRNTKKLWGHPEGIWARAWEVFQQDRQSAEHERAYLLGRREKDEFWYATRFERNWPTTNSISLAPPKKTNLPSKLQFAQVLATLPPQPPQIISVNPSNGQQGYSYAVQISGEFLDGCTIQPIQGITISDPLVTTDIITANFVVGVDALTGERTVEVQNTLGSADGSFEVEIGIPELDAIDPSGGEQGALIPVTLTGTGFGTGTPGATIQPGDGVSVSGTPTTTSTSINATFSISPTAALGTNPVTVSFGGPASNSVGFSITAGPAPDIDSINPNEGAAGTTVSITIVGSNLAEVTVNVPSGITLSSLNNSSSTQTTAKFVISASATPGIYNITVTNPRNQTSNAVDFTIA